MILNTNDIQKIIPHRYPFLLVDRILELEVGIKAVGIKCVSVNEAHFLGHFEQEHVMPGVLIIEALAQVGAVALLAHEDNKGKLAYFAGIKEAKFRRKVIPGDVLRLESEVIRMRNGVGLSKAVATVDGELACECELMFALGK